MKRNKIQLITRENNGQKVGKLKGPECTPNLQVGGGGGGESWLGQVAAEPGWPHQDPGVSTDFFKQTNDDKIIRRVHEGLGWPVTPWLAWVRRFPVTARGRLGHDLVLIPSSQRYTGPHSIL